MAEWDGEDHEDEYRYLWEGLDNTGGDWDFDALNEDGADWNIWGEPPAPHHHSPHHRNISSSSTLNSSSTAWTSNSQDHSSSSAFEPVVTSPDRPMGAALSTGPTQARISYNPTTSQSHHTVPSTSSDQVGSGLLRQRVSQSQRLHQSQPDSQPRTFGYIPEAFASPSASDASPSTNSQSFDGIDIDDLLATDSEESEEEMPPRTATTPRTRRQPGENIVDLTADSSPPHQPSPQNSNPAETRQPRSLKRTAAAELAAQARASKRPRSSHHSSPTTAAAANPHANRPIEELDLTNEAPSAEEELLGAQQAAAIAAQQAADNEDGSGAPLKIGRRQCIICMEPFTDITITHCGHVYCHECLTQALNAGEKNGERGVGNCPVCRKPVRRSKANQMIVVSFMKKGTFKGKATRSRAVMA